MEIPQFSVVTSAAGGGGGRYQPTNPAPATDLGQAGGSGGGSGGVGPSATMDGGAGNDPPSKSLSGNPGGQGQHLGGCCHEIWWRRWCYGSWR